MVNFLRGQDGTEELRTDYFLESAAASAVVPSALGGCDFGSAASVPFGLIISWGSDRKLASGESSICADQLSSWGEFLIRLMKGISCEHRRIE